MELWKSFAFFWAVWSSFPLMVDSFHAPILQPRQSQQPFLLPASKRILTKCRESASDNNKNNVDNTKTTITTEEPLSDVDTRVLQSMLQDAKLLDLNTEDDVRKLLERGVVKTTKTVNTGAGTGASGDDDEASQYSSTVLKAFTDTKLWRKVSAQASDVLESVGIWVSNRVEQDVKVLAALGLFAWERAVTDVARALPATSSAAIPRNFLLSNSTSYTGPPKKQSRESIMKEMNRPSDEIQSVTRSVLDILKGSPTQKPRDRGLRTTAPAGSGAAAAERQRRAYTQRTQMRKQEQDVTRVAGNFADTAWELKQELKSERSQPGYKTEGIRNAIEAGVVGTANRLQGFQREAQLAAAKRQEQRRLQGAVPLASAPPVESTPQASVTPVESKRDTLLPDLLSERLRIVERLQTCIEEPENTWLRQEVLAASDEPVHFDTDALQEIVTTLILVRNDLNTPLRNVAATAETFESVIEQLRVVRRTVEDLRARSAEAVSYTVANALHDEILGLIVGGDVPTKPSVIMRLDELEEIVLVDELEEIVLVDEDTSAESNEQFNFSIEDEDKSVPWFAEKEYHADYKPEETARIKKQTKLEKDVLRADIIEVVPEVVIRSYSAENGFIETSLEGAEVVHVVIESDDIDASSAGLIAELVTDDDFDVAVGQRKTAVAVPEDEDDEKTKDNGVLVQATLRSLDVLFFVVEKTLTVGIPKIIATSQTVSSRVDEVNRSGMGTKGWENIRNTVTGSRRY
jgi:hypothetical protein